LVRVKICGLTTERDVAAVVDAGTDAVGFIVGFPASPRNISMDRATELGRQVPPFVDRVLVTRASVVASSLDRVARFRPGAVQLYGDGVDLEKVRSATGAALIRPQAADLVGQDFASLADGYDALLTDSYVGGMDGGTGVTSDWTVSARIRKAIAPTPLVLSGGLNPSNVSQAIAAVEPYAVDVSSGVEASPGKKDPAKVALFVSRAKEGPG
jgi:phosphoribosylanthranilate isomerase